MEVWSRYSPKHRKPHVTGAAEGDVSIRGQHCSCGTPEVRHSRAKAEVCLVLKRNDSRYLGGSLRSRRTAKEWSQGGKKNEQTTEEVPCRTDLLCTVGERGECGRPQRDDAEGHG